MVNEQLQELALQLSKLPPIDPETDKPIESFLVKYVVLAEWMDGSGSRYLVRRASTGTGEGISPWDYKGLLHEALFGTSW